MGCRFEQQQATPLQRALVRTERVHRLKGSPSPPRPRNNVAPAAAASITAGKQVSPLADLSADSRMVKVVAAIIDRSRAFSAPDVFSGLQQLSELHAQVRWAMPALHCAITAATNDLQPCACPSRPLQCRVELAKTDLLVVPTAAYNYTLREIEVRRVGALARSGPPAFATDHSVLCCPALVSTCDTPFSPLFSCPFCLPILSPIQSGGGRGA